MVGMVDVPAASFGDRDLGADLVLDDPRVGMRHRPDVYPAHERERMVERVFEFDQVHTRFDLERLKTGEPRLDQHRYELAHTPATVEYDRHTFALEKVAQPFLRREFQFAVHRR